MKLGDGRRGSGSGRRESINVSTAPLPDRLNTNLEKADGDPDLDEENPSM
jgi:hypothetical protein